MLLVLVNLFGPGSGDGGDDGAVADVSGQTDGPRDTDTSPVPVDTPPVTPEIEAACDPLMAALPLDLAGDPSRQVDSDTLYAYAWGDPPTVLRCGVPLPAGYEPGVGLIQVEGVTWFVDTSDPTVNTWTTVDRTQQVELAIPSSTDGAGATELSRVIAGTVPAA